MIIILKIATVQCTHVILNYFIYHYDIRPKTEYYVKYDIV